MLSLQALKTAIALAIVCGLASLAVAENLSKGNSRKLEISSGTVVSKSTLKWNQPKSITSDQIRGGAYAEESLAESQNLDGSVGSSEEDSSLITIFSSKGYQPQVSDWASGQESRLLDAANFQYLSIRNLQESTIPMRLSLGLLHSNIVLNNDERTIVNTITLPLEMRAQFSSEGEFISALQFSNRQFTSSALGDTSEALISAGVGYTLLPKLYGQLATGMKFSQLEGQGVNKAFDLHAQMILSLDDDTKYSLSYKNSEFPTLTEQDYVMGEVIGLSGEFDISRRWSGYVNLTQSWAEWSSGKTSEYTSSEMLLSYDLLENFSLSGGYLFRTGSLELNGKEKEEEGIMKFSASFLY